MTLPLLILRPIEGARKTQIAAESCGLKAVVDPLFEIESVSWTASTPGQYDAIMFTSANAVKMAGSMLSNYLELPALAVGEVTAQAASDAGFQISTIGRGGAQSLVDMLPDGSFSNILRLSGRDYTSVCSDRTIETVPAYQSVDIGLGLEAKQSLERGCAILLHSTKAAQVLSNAMDKARIDRSKNHIIAISSVVAEAVGNSWNSITIADNPTDDALLSAATRLCSD